MEATAYSIYQEELEYPYSAIKRDRMLSLGNVSAPPVLNLGMRFSSVSGGYSSLIDPPRRFSYGGRSHGGRSYGNRGHRKSTSDSSRILNKYNMGESFQTDDFFLESDGEEADDEFEQITTTAEIGYPNSFLSVPGKVIIINIFLILMKIF